MSTKVLLNKLVSLGLDYAQRKGINTVLLNKWKRMLDTINAVLNDAEDKQLSGNHPVKLWLDDVRDLAYDMEDLLDEFAIEAAQAKSEAESSTSRGQVKRKFSFFGLYKSSRSNPNLCSLVSQNEIQEINDRLEEIVTRKAFLSLKENVVYKSDCSNKRSPSTSLPEPCFFGREKEEAQMLELLTGEVENGDTMLSIVPIVGMGSTIAGLSCEGKDLNWLQVKLKDNLSGKKFLVVLDDVWNEKYGEWTDLLKPFEAGAKGSQIIVTTRNISVVSLTRASPYPLKELSLDNCTSLLGFHALGDTNLEGHPQLETIGQKIAEKCATCVTSGESQLVGDEGDASLKEKARYASLILPHLVTSRCLRACDGMKRYRIVLVS
ncbi:putative disease resistance RPP13-like protein 1 [Syzygium oleosum]|uniref:putative disease resistance RPP13-like protein 1 n=1 Tax=Syzygium oleosum TaxID=219896 RepID=UPI0024B93CB8|nr:putative disease resistance RPP13-like protein 1 [Syzygium oleosum]